MAATRCATASGARPRPHHRRSQTRPRSRQQHLSHRHAWAYFRASWHACTSSSATGADPRESEAANAGTSEAKCRWACHVFALLADAKFSACTRLQRVLERVRATCLSKSIHAGEAVMVGGGHAVGGCDGAVQRRRCGRGREGMAGCTRDEGKNWGVPGRAGQGALADVRVWLRSKCARCCAGEKVTIELGIVSNQSSETR